MTDLAAIVDRAFDLSADAAFATLDTLKGDTADCGGAWVVIPRQKDGTALLSAIQTRNIRVGKHHTGGISVHILGGLRCQSRLPREKGCAAFVQVLNDAGFQAHTYSYAD